MPGALDAVGAGLGVSPLIADLGQCLVAAGVLVILFRRMRLPAIAAMLAAGFVIGPSGLATIQEQGSIDTIAGLGLTLLLFAIGLEIDLRGLIASGRPLLVTGLLQVPLTIAIAGGGFSLIGLTGWALIDDWRAALYLGAACAFSSTLLVVRFLQDRLLLDTVRGRTCVGLLIFQDLWAIVALTLQPNLATPAVGPIVLTIAGTVFVIVVAVVVARTVLPRALTAVDDDPELVVTVALAWCFAVGLLGAHLGDLTWAVGLDLQVSVSMEMGALIAGATIATSTYAREVVSRVSHLRDFFVTLFFIGIGMSIPVPDGVEVIGLALLLAVVAMALRPLLFMPLLYVSGLDRRNSLDVSTKLAQVSEFCLVIVYVGARLGHVDARLVGAVILAFVITAVLTPVMFQLNETLYPRLRGLLDRLGIRSRGPQAEAETAEPPRLVLLGSHRIGSALLASLHRLHPDLLPRTLVIDLAPHRHPGIQRLGARTVYGDVASADVLRHAGVGDAEVIVSVLPDELLKGTSNEQLVRAVRAMAPRAAIIANATSAVQVPALEAAGADHVFRVPTEVAHGVLPAIYAALNGDLPDYLAELHDRHGAAKDRAEVME